MKNISYKLTFLLTTAVVVLVSIFPFLWFVSTSFKREIEISSIPPIFIPSFNMQFYQSTISNYDIFLYIKNSLLVAGCTTIITIFISSLAGYALACLKLKGKRLIMGIILASSMFPQISIAGPIWRILDFFGWLNCYQGLILPYVTLTLPLGIWILASFFDKLPKEIEEAAMIDGCSHIQVLLKIIAPLSLPGIFTASILVFIYAWNEFFFALLVMTEEKYRTLPVGIALFQGQYTMPWGEIAAASTIATIPLVILVMFFQKQIVSGLSAGAVKE
ncbi:MAG: carbohydrate ABC transporter permease [Candidatus Schekmanbacteria bacterium]|nr:MAG: carbohydrate ABC transporter permease [Candidatus Schekmanbacteria bacterium]